MFPGNLSIHKEGLNKTKYFFPWSLFTLIGKGSSVNCHTWTQYISSLMSHQTLSRNDPFISDRKWLEHARYIIHKIISLCHHRKPAFDYTTIMSWNMTFVVACLLILKLIFSGYEFSEIKWLQEVNFLIWFLVMAALCIG